MVNAPAPNAPAPAAPAGAAGTGTLTITGASGAAYKFDKVDCAGQKDPAGDIIATATSSTAPDVTAILTRSSGKATVLITAGTTDPTMWTDTSGAPADAYTRTVDTVTITALPVERTGGLLTDKPTGTLTGTLTCASTAALV